MKSRQIQLRSIKIDEKQFKENVLYICVSGVYLNWINEGYGFKRNGIITGYLNGIFYDGSDNSMTFPLDFRFVPCNAVKTLVGINNTDGHSRTENFV